MPGSGFPEVILVIGILLGLTASASHWPGWL